MQVRGFFDDEYLTRIFCESEANLKVISAETSDSYETGSLTSPLAFRSNLSYELAYLSPPKPSIPKSSTLIYSISYES